MIISRWVTSLMLRSIREWKWSVVEDTVRQVRDSDVRARLFEVVCFIRLLLLGL